MEPKLTPPTKPRDGLSLRLKVLLSLGDGTTMIHSIIAGFYLNHFFLETCCLDPGLVATIHLVQGCFDAMNDPVMGYLSDRTRTCWGRRRPWLLGGGPIIGVSYILLWNTLPQDVSMVWRTLYHMAAYMCVSVGITMIIVPCGALVSELTTNYDERTTVSALRMIGVGIMGTGSAFVHSLIVSDRSPAQYRISALIFGTLMCCGAWVIFAGIREQQQSFASAEVPVHFFQDLREILCSRGFLFVSIIYLCGPTAVMLAQSNLFLFCKYVIRDPDLIQIAVPLVAVTGMGCVPFWMVVGHRTSKRTMYFCSGTMMAASFLAMTFIESKEALLAVATSFGCCLTAVYMVPWAMLPDVVEEDVRRTGRRREGMFTSLFAVSLKLSSTLALTMSNLILKEAGYVAPVSTCGGGVADMDTDSDADLSRQPQAVLLGVRLLCGVIPASLLFIAMATALFSKGRTHEAENDTQTQTKAPENATLEIPELPEVEKVIQDIQRIRKPTDTDTWSI